MTTKVSKRVVQNAMYMATVGTLIYLGVTFLPNLVYEDFVLNTWQQVFEMVRSSVVVWIAVFAGESGYTLLWLQKTTRKAKPKNTKPVSAPKSKAEEKIANCITESRSLSSLIYCYEKVA